MLAKGVYKMNSSTSLDLPSYISTLDLIVLFAIIGLTILSICYGHTLKAKVENDGYANFLEHLVMGRKLTLPLFVATLVASWYGGIFGVTEIAFTSGIYNFLTQGVFWYITYIIFALFIVDKLSSYNAITLPEVVGKMFGKKAGQVAAVFNFFNVLPVAYSLSLGIFIQMLLGLSLPASTALGTALVCLYSIFGGMRSDVFSDVVQFFVMCSSVLLVVLFASFQFGGMGFLKANLPPSHFSPLGGNSIYETMVWGFIALATLVDPCFYQRCFAVEKPKIAKRGILVCTLIWCCFDICTTLGAMYARAIVPMAEPNHAYLLFAMKILPSGLRGFFLAGIIAVIISTLDSFLIIASHTLTYDLTPSRFHSKMYIHRIGAILVSVFAVILTLFFDGSIKSIWKILGSYSAGCLLVPMIIGYLKPGFISERSFITTSLISATAITLWRLTSHSGFWVNVDALYVGIFCTSICLGTFKIAEKFSRLTVSG